MPYNIPYDLRNLNVNRGYNYPVFINSGPSRPATPGEMAGWFLLGIIASTGYGLFNSFNWKEPQLYETRFQDLVKRCDRLHSHGTYRDTYTCSGLPKVDSLKQDGNVWPSRIAGLGAVLASTVVCFAYDKLPALATIGLGAVAIGCAITQHMTIPYKYHELLTKEQYVAQMGRE